MILLLLSPFLRSFSLVAFSRCDRYLGVMQGWLTKWIKMRALASICLLSACSNVENWTYDKPSIRALQKESLVGIPAKPIAGQSLEEFFLDKVGLIVTSSNRFPSGRAVSITHDGYYLTAWHVVDEGEFFLSDFVILKPLPEGVAFKAEDYRRIDRHLGRVVWHDPKVDLAIVKFDFQSAHRFQLANYRSQIGGQVFSGAAGTNSGSLVTSEGRKDGVGNGPFLTAGVILKSKNLKSDPAVVGYQSTLVARGGMSGGPVVDQTGNLIGIITKIHASLLSAPTTAFAMMSASKVGEIVTRDRNEKTGTAPLTLER